MSTTNQSKPVRAIQLVGGIIAGGIAASILFPIAFGHMENAEWGIGASATVHSLWSVGDVIMILAVFIAVIVAAYRLAE